MKKLAIIALAALTLAPSAANAFGWHDFTCLLFSSNCDRSERYDRAWWSPEERDTFPSGCAASAGYSHMNQGVWHEC